MTTALKVAALFAMLGFSGYRLFQSGQIAMMEILAAILGLLVFFSAVSLVLHIRRSPMAVEIRDRTETWWFMAAVFMLALSTHRLVSFTFLGFLCFSALREYYSLMPMKNISGDKVLAFKDRVVVLITYLWVPAVVYIAYIRWYELFIIMVPVYLFLLMPIVFVVQDRTEGAVKSLGIITLGVMMFAFNLGHSLFMINLSPILLLFAFGLTESRDVVAFWVGKAFARLAGLAPGSLFAKVLEAPIAPTINPRKSWAGGLVSAGAMAALALLFVPILPPLGEDHLRASGAFCAFAGFLIGVLGLAGDLVFGMIKRDLRVKDTGSALPGHGGIIDRVNSLIFTVPVTFHLFYWRFF